MFHDEAVWAKDDRYTRRELEITRPFFQLAESETTTGNDVHREGPYLFLSYPVGLDKICLTTVHEQLKVDERRHPVKHI